MAGMMDGRELDQLSADLAAAVPLSRTNIAKALEVTAINTRQDAKSAARGITWASKYPQSITHEVRSVSGGVEAEVGPEYGKPQGALGEILELGSVNNAPRKHLGPALDRNEADFVKGLEIAITDSLRGFL